ncbi:MAG: hypothetical protein PVH87_01935 [Desulfobacteraceae bacterium]|jgi:hypothetical protein
MEGKKAILSVNFALIMLMIVGLNGQVDAQDKKQKISTNSEIEEVLEIFDDQNLEGKFLSDELEDTPDAIENDTVKTGDVSRTDINEKPNFVEPSGTLSLGISIAFAHDTPSPAEADYRGIVKFRPDLHLELNMNLSDHWRANIGGRAFYDLAYCIHDRDQFTEETLDEYESEVELQEVYLLGSLFENLDLKVGRQIVVWGKSDNIRVVDVINPLDQREPGLVDNQDLRLPVTMTKADYYFGLWSLTGIAVHEIRFNKMPVFGSEFFPADNPPPPEVGPNNTLDNTEYAFALNGIFSGWDIAFYWARFFDDTPHVEMIAPMQFVRRHSRIDMAGMAAGLALGNWLIKTELAYLDGLEYFSLPGEKKERFDTLLGVEYRGLPNTSISLEAVNRHIDDFDSRLENSIDAAQEDEFQAMLRYSGDYRHDQLHLQALVSIFDPDGEGGSFERFSIGYDLNDAVAVTLGVVFYQSGDRREMRDIGDNDRVYIEFAYSF